MITGIQVVCYVLDVKVCKLVFDSVLFEITNVKVTISSHECVHVCHPNVSVNNNERL